MILQLGKGKINIVPMKVPEPLGKVYIQYTYEHGTNHLTPRLTLNGKIYEGDRMYVDVDIGEREAMINIKVELLDPKGFVIKTYKKETRFIAYGIFGKKPVRPDVDKYIRDLEAKIEKLENEGEVI